MILLIDNYDSFTYNLYQMIGGFNSDIKVVRNDKITIDEIRALAPSHIVLSPGPGKPCDAGICIEVIAQLHREIPILGVCLGHQAICEAFGATVSYAGKLMHGKSSEITVVNQFIFKDLSTRIKVGRYHSLVALRETIPSELEILGTADDGEIMAVRHCNYPVYGIQFHPESILTPKGNVIIENFLTITTESGDGHD